MGQHAPQIETVVALVHQRDDLLAERSRLTAQIDQRIAEVDARLGQMVGAPALTRPTIGTAVKVTVLERVLDQLRRNPAVDNGVLAVAIYGEDSAHTRHNIRAQLWQLRKKGLVQQVPGGGGKPTQAGNGAVAMT